MSPRFTPHVVRLEDRSTPAMISGNTISLDDATETLTVSYSGTYTFTSSTDGLLSFTPTGTVTIQDLNNGAAVLFADSTSTYPDSFNVLLDDAPGLVQFDGTSNFGTNSLTVTTSRNIAVNSGATLRAGTGNIGLFANEQSPATTGSFRGVEIQGTVRGGDGTVSISGRGGDAAGGTQYGVWVRNGGSVSSTGTGTVSIAGTGGAGTGNANAGVVVENSGSFVSSNGGVVSVSGLGGGSGSSSTTNHVGVVVQDEAVITSGTGANVDVQGTGGLGTGGQNAGVVVSQNSATITSGGGKVSVIGQAGAGSSSGNGVYVTATGVITSGTDGAVSVTGNSGRSNGNSNYGVFVLGTGAGISSGGGNVVVSGTSGGTGTDTFAMGVVVGNGGQVSAGGSGTVGITGTAGAATGTLNYGVLITDATTLVTSLGGAVSVTGTGGSGTDSFAVMITSSAGVISGGNAAVTVSADSLTVDASSTISAGSGTVTIAPRTNGTPIDLGGADVLSGTPLTLGISDAELDRITAGTIVIGRADSASTITVSAAVQHAGDADLTLLTAKNIVVNNGASLTSNAGDLTLTANQQATHTTGNFIGIDVQGTVSGATGTVTVAGTGGDDSGGFQTGVRVAGGGQVTSSGSGAVSVTGTGGAGGTGANNGVVVENTNSLISSGGGAVSVTGEGGGSGTSGSNFGVVVQSTGTISAGSTGTVTVTGTGGSGSGSNNFGVSVSGTDAKITSGGGAVSVTGQGGGGTGSGSNNDGVRVESAGQITSAGTGTVTVTGTGGSGSGDNNAGVAVIDTDAKITSGGGAVSVTGQGGGGTGSGSNNDGVRVQSAGQITSAGTGTVTVTGTGGSGSGDNNAGVAVIDTDAKITSGGGNVGVTGQGGGGTGSGNFNYGVRVQSAGQITSAGAGTVTVMGTGGSGSGTDNIGVDVSGTDSKITSGGGAVQVTGQGGGGSGNFNYGVLVEFAGQITSAGTGTVTVMGTGGSGSGTDNYGVWVTDTDSKITSGGGNVGVTGQGGGGSNNLGVKVESGGVISSGSNAAITITADSVDLSSTLSVNAGTGTVTIRPKTAGTLIDLGINSTGFSLTDAELDRVTAGVLVIGDTAAGDIVVSTLSAHMGYADLRLVTGGNIFLNADITTAAVSMTAGGTVRPTASPTDVTATSGLTFGPGTALGIAIAGTTPDTQFTQLNVAGAVDLTGATLALTGAYVPIVGDSFVIVSGSSVSGTFSGLPNNVVTFNGVSLHAVYSATAVTLVANLRPTGASAGGPYTIAEGSGLTLTATATDPDGDALSYTWDVNGDGVFGDATGANPTLTATQLASLGLADGPFSTSALAVRVSDGLSGGTVTSAAGTLTITNVDPTVTTFTVPGFGTVGTGVSVSAAATDPAGAADPLTFTWDVDRGGVPFATGSGANFTFTPDAAGTYEVTVFVTDGDGGSTFQSTTVDVAPAPLPPMPPMPPMPPAPTPAITAFNVPSGGLVGEVVRVSASATDPSGTGGLLFFSWSVTKNGFPFATGTGTSFVFTPDAGAAYSVSLTVSLQNGGTATRTAAVSVAAVVPRIVTSVGGKVRVYNPINFGFAEFEPYPTFPGPITVATADLNGDGFKEVVTGAGPGGGPHVKVFDGRTMAEVASFFAYDPGFPGGVFVSAANGRIATGAGGGGTAHVKVIAFAQAGNLYTAGPRAGEIHDDALLATFFAIDPMFTEGVRVALSDLTGDGLPEVVATVAVGGPQVLVFAGTSFVQTALFEVNGTGTVPVFVAAGGGRIAVGVQKSGSFLPSEPLVKVYDPAGNEQANFLAFDKSFAGGVRVAFADVNGDGVPDLVTGAGPGGGPNVRAYSFSPFAQLFDAQVADPLDPRGVFVA